jgi:mediator of RNA polymerase II transcription subunit 14
MMQVDKCNTIMVFLEKQSTTFLETADQLARMARETLVRATLPNFHLPAAAEILTTGGYTRLPRCIKVSVADPDPGCGAFFTPASRMGKKFRIRDPDPG